MAWELLKERAPKFCSMRRATLVYALALASAAITASAIPIPTNITVSNNGTQLNVSGVAKKAQYGQQNNNPTSNLVFLNKEIGSGMRHLTPIYPPRTAPLRLVLTVSATHHRIMLSPATTLLFSISETDPRAALPVVGGRRGT